MRACSLAGAPLHISHQCKMKRFIFVQLEGTDDENRTGGCPMLIVKGKSYHTVTHKTTRQDEIERRICAKIYCHSMFIYIYFIFQGIVLNIHQFS